MTTDPKGDLDPGLVAFFALRKELIISADKILNYTKPWLYRKIAKQTPAPHYRDLAELRENLELKEEDVQLSHCNSPLFGTLAYIDGIARRVLPQETKTHNSRLRKSDHALLAVVERLHPHIIKDVLILLPDEVVAKVNERSGALIQPVLSGGYKLMHHGPH